MKSLVVFLALAAVACGSVVPAYHSALVLEPHATVYAAPATVSHQSRVDVHSSPAIVAHAAPIAHAAVVAPAVVAAPAAVSHQSRVDVHSSPAVVAHASPLVSAYSVATPWLGYSAYGLAAHGHYLKKRSLGHIAYSTPIIAPAAVSHQSRVDVHSSPAVVAYAAPIAHAAVVAPAVIAAPAAVSHQSRVDVHSSPAVVAHASPLVSAYSVASPWLGYSAYGLAAHGHYLKKRSLGHIAYSTPIIAPAAVSHQSRVDVVSSPAVVSHAVAAPVLAHAVATPVVAHAIAPAAVSHQSRVDVHSSPAISVAAYAPYAHSVVAASPLLHSAPLVHASPLTYGASHLVHSW